MEITEQVYNQLQQTIAEQKQQIAELKGKSEEEQVKEYLQAKAIKEKDMAERCERVKQSFR